MRVFLTGILFGVLVTALSYPFVKKQFELSQLGPREAIVAKVTKLELIDFSGNVIDKDFQVFQLAIRAYNKKNLNGARPLGFDSSPVSAIRHNPPDSIVSILKKIDKLNLRRFDSLSDADLIEYSRFLTSRFRRLLYQADQELQSEQNLLQNEFNYVFENALRSNGT